MEKPKNIEHAIDIIIGLLNPKQKLQLENSDDQNDPWINYHFSIGLTIRNSWFYQSDDWFKDEIRNYDPMFVDSYSSELIELSMKKIRGHEYDIKETMEKINWIEYYMERNDK